MSYNIVRTNGEALYPNGLPEGITDTLIYTGTEDTGGMIMIGKLVPEYGADQSNNFVHLIENFANDKFPDSPLLGMLFYNSSDNCVYICTEENGINSVWDKLVAIQFSRSENPKNGDLWYDAENKKLYIYDASENIQDYVLVGPSNYYHKVENSFDLVTSADMTSQSHSIYFDNKSTNLVTLKIAAREDMSDDYMGSNPYKVPETAAWLYRVLVHNYYDETLHKYVSEIIGEPSYELIGRTSGEALNWNVLLEIGANNDLRVSAEGYGDISVHTNDDQIKWTFDVEIIKV